MHQNAKTETESIKLWLDDIRPAPKGWVWVKTFQECIRFLMGTVRVSIISLDHDLATEETGYDVAVFIENCAFLDLLPPMGWRIHSANPVGCKKMEAALRNADKFWNDRKRAYARRDGRFSNNE